MDLGVRIELVCVFGWLGEKYVIRNVQSIQHSICHFTQMLMCACFITHLYSPAVCVCLLSSCTAYNETPGDAEHGQTEHSWRIWKYGVREDRQEKRKDDNSRRGYEGRWWRFKATEVCVNGLLCIQLVAAGFWKALHTLPIRLVKGKTTVLPHCQASISLHFLGCSSSSEQFFSARHEARGHHEKHMPQMSVSSHQTEQHCLLCLTQNTSQ